MENSKTLENTLKYNSEMTLNYNAPVTEEVVELPRHAEALEMLTSIEVK